VRQFSVTCAIIGLILDVLGQIKLPLLFSSLRQEKRVVFTGSVTAVKVVQKIATSPSPIVGNTQLSTIMKELKERESRAKNIIFSGCNSDTKVESFLGKCGVTPISIKKIGKTDKKLHLVELSSEADKWKALGKAKELCSSVDSFQGMYVNPDLTQSEREHQYQLRKECRERRSKGENVKIKKGVVVVVE